MDRKEADKYNEVNTMKLETYQICMHCDNKQQATDLLNKVKELDQDNQYMWKYKCWKPTKEINNNMSEYHEVLAWVEGLENATSAQIMLSSAMNYIKESNGG